MEKIHEGLYAYRGNDHVVTTTKNVDALELQNIIRTDDLFYAALEHIDREKGLVKDEEVHVDYNRLTSFYCIPSEEQITVAKCHIYEVRNDESGSSLRGKNQIVHFIRLDKDIKCHTIDLLDLSTFSLGNRELLEYLEPNQGFETISPDEVDRLYNKYDMSEFLMHKKSVVRLLTRIINAKLNNKTLYVCYPIEEYNNFLKIFRLALKFLPKEISNSLSYITLYGGGIKAGLNVVGVPSDDEELIRSSHFENNSGTVYYFEEDLEEEFKKNAFFELFDKISNEPQLLRLERFVYKDGKSYSELSDYLLALELYSPLFDEVARFQGDEANFVGRVISNLAYFTKNIHFIESEFSESEKRDLLNNLMTSFRDFSKVANFGESGFDRYLEILVMIRDLSTASDPLIRQTSFEFLLEFAFDFVVNKDNSGGLYVHNQLLNILLTDSTYADLIYNFISYIYPAKEGQISTLFKEFSTIDSAFVDTAVNYYELLLSYLLNNYERLMKPKNRVCVLLNLYKFARSQMERLNFLFSSALSTKDKFDILLTLLLETESSDKELPDYAIRYIAENDLLVTSINEIKPSYYHDTKGVLLNFKKDIIDAYLGVDHISTYSELKVAIDRLYYFTDSSNEFNEVKERLIYNIDQEFDLETISSLLIKNITEDGDDAYFARIKEVLSKDERDSIKKIIQAINNKLQERAVAEEASKLEDELIEFRVVLLARIMLTLPERVSKNLIRNNDFAHTFAKENGYGAYMDLKGDAYNTLLEKFVLAFFTSPIKAAQPEPVLERRRLFAIEIVNSQDERKFNVRNFTSAISNFALSILIGGGSLIAGFLSSFVFAKYFLNGSYIIIRIVLSIIAAVLAFVMTFVNTKNKGRGKTRYGYIFYSVIEAILILVLTIGVFLMISMIMGGK